MDGFCHIQYSTGLQAFNSNYLLSREVRGNDRIRHGGACGFSSITYLVIERVQAVNGVGDLQ
jgi:hypothetical protein